MHHKSKRLDPICHFLRSRYLIIFALFSLLLNPLNSAFAGAEVGPTDKKRAKTQIHWMIATYQEKNKIQRTDTAQTLALNSLNSVMRLGLTHYFNGAIKTFFRYGLILGQSRNESAETTFSFFQRSAPMAGAELALGFPMGPLGGGELGLTLGGLYRLIDLTLPSKDYKPLTQTGFIPQLTLEYLWRLSETIYWRQGLGTQGGIGDTYWTAGLGFDW